MQVTVPLHTRGYFSESKNCYPYCGGLEADWVGANEDVLTDWQKIAAQKDEYPCQLVIVWQ